MPKSDKPWLVKIGFTPDKAISMFEQPVPDICYDDLDRKVEEALGISLPLRKDSDGRQEKKES